MIELKKLIKKNSLLINFKLILISIILFEKSVYNVLLCSHLNWIYDAVKKKLDI